MRAILVVSALSMWLLGGTVSAADVSRAEVAADCRAEGKAMGVPESGLNDYVKDCIEEFLGSEMVNNQSSGRKK